MRSCTSAMIELLARHGAGSDRVLRMNPGTAAGLAVEKGRTPLRAGAAGIDWAPILIVLGYTARRRSTLPPGRATGRCSTR